MTQTNIARAIIERGGNYLMALKGNQGTLFSDVKYYFERIHPGMSGARTIDKNRGQVEIRTCTQTSNIKWLEQIDEWIGLKTLVKIELEVIKENNEVNKEARY